jgi:hypothetical protein
MMHSLQVHRNRQYILKVLKGYTSIDMNMEMQRSTYLDFETQHTVDNVIRSNCNEFLVEALYYKPERRWFDSRWGHWIFQLTESFQPHYGLGVESASNRNEYQESSCK